jgi:hypothetical protein
MKLRVARGNLEAETMKVLGYIKNQEDQKNAHLGSPTENSKRKHTHTL